MKILTLSQIRAAEKGAVESGTFSFADLMQTAAEHFVRILEKNHTVCGREIIVAIGNGNNGGDGMVIADILSKKGAKVKIYAPLGLPSCEPAVLFLNSIKGIKAVIDLPDKCDILVDALFGIGLNRELEGFAADIVNKMNFMDAVKISVDIPSGINCNGTINKGAFRADETITFIGYKLCFVLPKTNEYCGRVTLANLGVKANECVCNTLEKPIFKRRLQNSHKGTFGKALMITGSYGMCGAQILSTKAALVTGVGLAKAIVCDKNYSAFCTAVPEAVAIPVDTATDGSPDVYDAQLLNCLNDANALLIGCGLGCTDETKRLMKRVLSFANIPTVIDADGINCISEDISIIEKTKAPVILTPHSKEMARLCKTSVEDIEGNRLEYAKRFANDYACVVVLKGHNTIIASPDGQIFVNVIGNSGLAKGGSGDVLSGIIVSKIAQGDTLLEAAKKAVWMHAFASESLLSRMTESGMLPSDVIEELKHIAE